MIVRQTFDGARGIGCRGCEGEESGDHGREIWGSRADLCSVVQCRKQRHVLSWRGTSTYPSHAQLGCPIHAMSEGLTIEILQDVQLSHIFPDSKTFVDKPTNGTLNSTLQAFAALGDNLTVEQIIAFVNTSFVGRSLGSIRAVVFKTPKPRSWPGEEQD